MDEQLDQAAAHFELHARAIRRLEAKLAQAEAAIDTLAGTLDEAASALLIRSIRTDFDRGLAERMRAVARSFVPRPTTPAPLALVPIEHLRAAELCELAAARLRCDDVRLVGLSLAECAVVEALAALAIQAERESRTR